jgi:WD40 repeat protein
MVTAIAAIPARGELVASGSADSTVRLWDLATGREVAKFSGHVAGVTSLAVSLQGDLLASASADGALKIWRIQ